jgi:hypothetical protein
MRKAIVYAAAGALALSSVGSAPTFGATLRFPPTSQERRALAEAKHEVKEEAAIRKVIAQAVDRGTGETGMTRLLTDVDRSDRERIEKGLTKNAEDTFKASAAKFHDMWKSKYDGKFDAQAHEQFLSNVQIVLTHEDKHATVTFPATGDVPPFTLELKQNKLFQWYIDVPDSLAQQTYENNMLAGIQKLQNGDKLPADVNQAYQQVAATILHPLASRS